MNHAAGLRAVVASIETLSASLRRIVLHPEHGGLLPAAGAGAHVLLTLPAADRSWRNAYSLVSPPGERRRYEIIVRRTATSRGGSVFLHDVIKPGDVLVLAAPVNSFPPAKLAGRHLLISAGIGVTPFLSFLALFRARGSAFELHHCCRAEDATAFAALLHPLADEIIAIHTRANPLALDRVLTGHGLDTHCYVCGPADFMADVTQRARALGWPTAKLHRESFGRPPGGPAFTVSLARSGLQLAVPTDRSLLEVLEDAGVDAPFMCRGGVCGQCRVTVLAGLPDHHDHVLNPQEQALGDAIMTCVSRARTPVLVLDL